MSDSNTIDVGTTFQEQIKSLQIRVRGIQDKFHGMRYDMRQIAQSEVKKRWKIQPQAETFFGLYTALCIDTLDPWKSNRVRFFSPLLNEPDTQIKSLDWAWPISSMGGFDDCGLNWVPPAGSTLVISFERGSRSSPYYHGTTWTRTRKGVEGARSFGYNIEEFYKIHEGHRSGYLVGPNDGSQAFAPWNTENSNGYDIDSQTLNEVETDPSFWNKMSYPHIYGFKTPQKHMFKLDDGDYKCNHRWKRVEIMTGCGNWLIFKDDHMHPCGQWANSGSGGTGGAPYGMELCPCVDSDGKAVEKTNCNDGCQKEFANPYFKHQNEMRPYIGPGTPQNNKCDLPQSGIQFLSLSGHTFLMDDSVNQPRGTPEWERSTKPFDFGCDDHYKGRTAWVSATGHEIEMNDLESPAKIRGNQNWIRMRSACGNKVELNDHTTPDCVAGSQRGIWLQSTSNHTLELCDNTNKQCSKRRGDGLPKNDAKEAYVRLRSGYGIEVKIGDNNTQKPITQSQYLHIFCPQYTNKCGPHYMLFQEQPTNGIVLLRVGGDYIVSTCQNHYTVVGDKKRPSDKVVVVSKDYMEITEEMYLNKAKVHVFLADEMIYLLAGKDCPIPGDGMGPCAFPVLVYTPWGITISDRVIASASKKSQTAPVWALQPFISNPKS